jgi:hypothetical protein
MLRILTATSVLAIFFFQPGTAAAQTHAKPERLWFSVSGGTQLGASAFSDAFDVPLYVEAEHVTVSTPVGGGTLLAGSGGYRMRRHLVVGVGVSHYNHRTDASVDAQVPYPFVDNRFREIHGSASTARTEAGVHLSVGWMMRVRPHVRLVVTAGPSVINVGQTLITDVAVSESYPYDTAAFGGVTTRKASRTAMGFNAAGDLFWMFSRTIGAGAVAQFTHLSAGENTAGGRTANVGAGGVQTAVGVRVIF